MSLLFLIASAPLLPAQVTSPDFSIVVLPDTQNEAQYYPQVMDAQMQWVVNNRASMNIQAVLGVGDIVNDGASDAQQQNASIAYAMLDNAGIPYFAAIGNHDYDGADVGAGMRTATGFNKWFGPSRYAGKPYYLGNYPAGSNENFYGVLTINGKQYLVMALEYYPRPAAVQWASGILAANPDKEAIIVTHAYMYTDGTRVDDCDSSNMDPNTSMYGDPLWDNLISQYPNVIMTVNGHFTSKLAARRADLGVNGNLVNQMFANYQDQLNGGNGWLRILTFHPANNTIDVKTYSPYLQQYKSDTDDQFTIYYHNPGYKTGAGQITGRVRTADCQSVAGATVSAGSASATTDPTGHFSLTVPAPAADTVSVWASGEQTQTRTLTVNDNYATDSNFYMVSSAAVTSCAATGTNHTVTICNPAGGSTVSSPVNVVASSTDTTGTVARMEIWLDGVKVSSTAGSSLDTKVPMIDGPHRLVVVAAESDSSYFKSTESITVSSSPPPLTSPTAAVLLTADPSTITAGQTSTLSWSSTNATAVTIDGLGTFGPTGTMTVAPATTTTYTATATSGAESTATSTATVNVQNASAGCALSTVNRTVTICTPSNNATVSSPVHLVANSTDTTAPILRMEVWVDGQKAYTTNANSLDTSVSMSNGTHRLVVVAAESNSSYFKSSEYITVSSAPNTAAPTVQFTANPAMISSGQSSTLSWTSTNANSVTIDGVGTFGASGTVTVSPTATTTYTATANGSGGTATSTVTVATSSSTAPTVHLTADPSTITAGQTSTLSWSSTNATAVTIDGLGTVAVTGSTTVSPTATTTYTATATGFGGSTGSGTATITVQNAPAGPCALSTVNRTVTICTPSNGATVSSPVHIVAGSTDTSAPVVRMEVWLDGVKMYSTRAASLDTNVIMSAGVHRIVVVAAESDTSFFKAVEYITVQ